MNRAELKYAAKQQIKGNIGMFLVVMLIVAALSFVASMIPVVGTILIVPPLTLGTAIIVLDMTHGDKVNLSRLFAGFSSFGAAVLSSILVEIFTFLWSLLFIIPGIIKALSYSMTNYILADNPDMTALEAINESKRIMDGHKGDLFVLYLSFIPWSLLCGITFGIASIYVIPYMSTTIGNFYNNIKDAGFTSNNNETVNPQ